MELSIYDFLEMCLDSLSPIGIWSLDDSAYFYTGTVGDALDMALEDDAFMGVLAQELVSWDMMSKFLNLNY